MGNIISPFCLFTFGRNHFEKIDPDFKMKELIQSLKYRKAYDSNNDPVVKLFTSTDPKTAELLINALKDIEPGVRQGAALVLGYRLEKSAIMPLVECLNDSDVYVRSTAINSLKKLKDIRAVKPLIACLKDPMSQVRRSAVITLGAISSNEALDALKTVVIEENDESIRALAKSILSKVKS